MLLLGRTITSLLPVGKIGGTIYFGWADKIVWLIRKAFFDDKERWHNHEFLYQCDVPPTVLDCHKHFIARKVNGLWRSEVNVIYYKQRPLRIFRESKLSIGYASLLFHDASLLYIDQNLSAAHHQKPDGENYLDPVRPNRGIPAAFGWAVMTLAGWWWAARHDYDALALVLLVSCFVGTYSILIALTRIIHEALEAAVLQRDRRAVFRGVGDAVVGV
jgi:hypothetical protein